ncbi:MAG: RidA family protein [Acidobacteriaceae bacterium]|jgi:reactive intermediate/imine deaminase|nr:RidA family protein [Acidobacteriaceae bacterium]
MPSAVTSPHLPAPGGFYSPAVRAGNLLFLSGQLPLDAHGRLVSGGIVEQTNQVLANLQHLLHAAGADLTHLVQVTIYVAGIEHWPLVNSTYAAFLAAVPVPPARAVVPVPELHYGALVEMQAIATINV